MINNDTLIKIVRDLGYKTNWPDIVNSMKSRLEFIKLGFPGIRNDHLSLIKVKDLKENGDIFIYDTDILGIQENNTDAPIMLSIERDWKCLVEGIGYGLDLERDPSRTKIRWKDIVDFPPLDSNDFVYRVDVRPTINGGPGYYYFFRSYRDFRC